MSIFFRVFLDLKPRSTARDMKGAECCRIVSCDLVMIGEQGYQHEDYPTPALGTGNFFTRFKVSHFLSPLLAGKDSLS